MVICLNQAAGKDYSIFNGDCVDVLRQVPDKSIGFSVYSPPFSNLFSYSDSECDMGNSYDDSEFFTHYGFLLEQMTRIMKPGRLAAVHCSDLPLTKWKDGVIGIKDFSGDLVRAHEAAGWILHSRVTVWKDPVVEMTRTKALGLLYKQLQKDSTRSRQGMADYVLVFRAPGENAEPVGQDAKNFPVEQWQKWASPVWMDIRQTNTLNVQQSKNANDTKHICLARGSMVLTRDGYRPIQDISVGDLVLTHKGRWRPVQVVRNTGVRPVVTIKAQGVPGLTLTPDHNVWTRKVGTLPGAVCHSRRFASSVEPSWVRADEAVGSYINLKLPPVEPLPMSDVELWLIGRWLADGHTGVRGDYYVSIGAGKLDYFEEVASYYSGARNELTATQIRLKNLSSAVIDVLRRCGRGAGGKSIPGDLLALPADQARSLLSGYLSGDGHFLEGRNRWTASSISRTLLLGISMLAQRAYSAIASLYAGRPPGRTTIEGRDVETRQDWILCFDAPDARRQKGMPFVLEDGAWKKVRKAEPAGEVETWCLRVEEDESFTAEGCVVKNCPLQLDLIERAILLWSNPGDVVLSPFMGIGSEGVSAVKLRRKFLGVELKDEYFAVSRKNLAGAEANAVDLFA